MSATEWEFRAGQVFIDEVDRTTRIPAKDILQIEWYKVPGTPDVRTVCDQPALTPVHNVVIVLHDDRRVVIPDQTHEDFQRVRNSLEAWWRR